MLYKNVNRLATLIIFISILFFAIANAVAEEITPNSAALNGAQALKQQLDVNSKNTAFFEVSESSDSQAVSLVKLFQGLGFCIAVFLIGVHLYKKFVLKSQPLMQRSMRIIEKLPISSKSSLLLVEIEKKKVLLATGPDGTVFLNDHELLNPSNTFFDVTASDADFQRVEEQCKAKVN